MWSKVGNRNLRTLIEERAQVMPEANLLTFEDVGGKVETFTYRQFDDNVNRVANGLLAMGIRKADKVNLHLRNCPEFLLVWFALSKIGALMVPTNPLLTAPSSNTFWPIPNRLPASPNPNIWMWFRLPLHTALM